VNVTNLENASSGSDRRYSQKRTMAEDEERREEGNCRKHHDTASVKD
jgi:hypothetical protein